MLKTVDKSTRVCYNMKEVDKSTFNHGIKEVKILFLEAVRFEKFVSLIDGIHKSISKIKFDIAPTLGVKSVHVFWLYELLLHPEGLTAAEIAAARTIDRSLVSREIEALKKGGYVVVDKPENKRNYNSRITLTDEGVALARKISDEALKIQNMVNRGIAEEELATFYITLEKLYVNFGKIIPTVHDKTAN